MTDSTKSGLISKMKRAYETGEVPATDRAESVAASSVDEPASVDGVEEIDRVDQLQQVPKVERGIIHIAKRLLEGEDISAQEARQGILDLIVETRFGDKLPDEKQKNIVETLAITLGEDVEFRTSIDRALIEAASKLGD